MCFIHYIDGDSKDVLFVCVCVYVLGTDLCSVMDHQCDHLCVSTPASYMCQCRRGYTLNSDGKTCRSE